jgi:hypothetical protein
LLATAIGVVAAIRAVVVYNLFARSIAGYRALLSDASATVLRHVSRDLEKRQNGIEIPDAIPAAGGGRRVRARGVIYHYYYLRDQAKTGENSGNAALYCFKGQDPGAFVSISGGGVLASSKHQADAQAFLKWVTGHAGQAVLRDGDACEYVVGEGEASNPKHMPLTDLDAPKVDVSKLNSKKVAELMTQADLL